LAGHKDVAMVALVGSVPTGRAVMRAAADTVKPVMLELGGKNALIAFADADADEVAGAVIAGMNFTWCGQSCGSTSRAFIREKIFGPVLGVFKWSDEAKMLDEVNMVEYGLTCSIWTNDISTAHRTAAAVEAGFVWINEVGKHFLGVPFGGVKQSGIGREECFDALLAFTQEKNIHVRLR